MSLYAQYHQEKNSIQSETICEWIKIVDVVNSKISEMQIQLMA